MTLLPYLFLGLLPSGLFFVWVERNMAIPWLSFELNWPWLKALDWPLPALLAVNAGLFALFGFTHSALARPRVLDRVARALGIGERRSARRRFYVTVTGLTLLAMMALWQPTGVIVWVLPLEWWTLQALSLAFFVASLGVGAWVIASHGVGEFLGARDPAAPQTEPHLQITGLYQYVRHPLYLATLVAFLAGPTMSLDRLWLTACLCVYLAIAIPLEEAKIIEELGEGYREYRKRVPALLPRFRAR